MNAHQKFYSLFLLGCMLSAQAMEVKKQGSDSEIPPALNENTVLSPIRQIKIGKELTFPQILEIARASSASPRPPSRQSPLRVPSAPIY